MKHHHKTKPENRSTPCGLGISSGAQRGKSVFRPVHRVHRNNRKNGFTLLELLIVITIAAILTTVGAPAYRNLIGTNVARGTGNLMAKGIRATRSLAKTRKILVTMSSKNGDWSNGYTVTESGTGTVIADTEFVEKDTVTVTSSLGGAGTLIFDSLGRATPPASTFQIQHAGSCSTKILAVSFFGKITWEDESGTQTFTGTDAQGDVDSGNAAALNDGWSALTGAGC